MAKKLFNVVKWNGESEYFQPKKLLNSLKRAGASKKIADRILDHIEGELQDGMKTTDIYKHAFELLQKNQPAVAARYDLKKALLRLGPSGYPFERFIAHLWERMGYKTEVGVMVSGECIEHEVDVIAESEDEVIMMECKYHNFHDTKSDVKTALYVDARMKDLRAHWEAKHKGSKKKFRGCLVTNTQFSRNALKYAQCAGLEVLAWSHPAGNSLAEMIDRVGLHPITCLTTLTEENVKVLLDKGHVLCQDLDKGMKDLKLKKGQRERVEEEAQELCQLPPKKRR